jgi:hypothetical protein
MTKKTWKMEDDKKNWKTTSNKMEDDLKKNGRQPQKKGRMEDKLFF